MANIEVTLEANNTEEVKEALKEAVQKALTEIGIQVENYATMLCPVDTGRLRGSITFATVTEQDSPREPAEASDGVQETPDENSVVIGTNVEYAAYVEMGTSKMDARPYLEPAVMNHVDEYQQMVEECLHNA